LCGNIDDAKNGISVTNSFMCEGVDVWITHIGGYPGKYNPILKQRWRQILKIIYLRAFAYPESDV
jgi:hypothetical protein